MGGGKGGKGGDYYGEYGSKGGKGGEYHGEYGSKGGKGDTYYGSGGFSAGARGSNGIRNGAVFGAAVNNFAEGSNYKYSYKTDGNGNVIEATADSEAFFFQSF